MKCRYLIVELIPTLIESPQREANRFANQVDIDTGDGLFSSGELRGDLQKVQQPPRITVSCARQRRTRIFRQC